MNKAELIEHISGKTDLSKAVAERVLTTILDSIVDSLKKDEPVVLVNFGTFIVKKRSARKGRNPKTGELIDIKASKGVSFKAGKAFKDAIKEEAVK